MNHGTAPRGAGGLQVNSVGVEDKVHCHEEDVGQRLEEKTQVDPLLKAVFDEHHHAEDVGRGAGENKSDRINH